jgi:hypothetical protein
VARRWEAVAEAVAVVEPSAEVAQSVAAADVAASRPARAAAAWDLRAAVEWEVAQPSPDAADPVSAMSP